MYDTQVNKEKFGYILEATNWFQMMKIMGIEEGYYELIERNIKIQCINDLKYGVWGVFLEFTDGELFTPEDIKIANKTLDTYGYELSCIGKDKIGVKFDGENDIIPTTNTQFSSFEDKTYKTINYARMIGLSLANSIYEIKYAPLEEPEVV